jgi:hypothetical protein
MKTKKTKDTNVDESPIYVKKEAKMKDEVKSLAKEVIPEKVETPAPVYMTKDDMMEFLSNNLKIRVSKAAGGFTDPNGRDIELYLGDTLVSSSYINVKHTREYGDY